MNIEKSMSKCLKNVYIIGVIQKNIYIMHICLMHEMEHLECTKSRPPPPCKVSKIVNELRGQGDKLSSQVTKVHLDCTELSHLSHCTMNLCLSPTRTLPLFFLLQSVLSNMAFFMWKERKKIFQLEMSYCFASQLFFHLLSQWFLFVFLLFLNLNDVIPI